MKQYSATQSSFFRLVNFSFHEINCPTKVFLLIWTETEIIPSMLRFSFLNTATDFLHGLISTFCGNWSFELSFKVVMLRFLHRTLSQMLRDTDKDDLWYFITRSSKVQIIRLYHAVIQEQAPLNVCNLWCNFRSKTTINNSNSGVERVKCHR